VDPADPWGDRAAALVAAVDLWAGCVEDPVVVLKVDREAAREGEDSEV
jgi:hypothetical protein